MHGSRVPPLRSYIIKTGPSRRRTLNTESIRPPRLVGWFFFLYRNSSIDDFGRIIGIEEKKKKKQKQITQNKSHSCIRS